MNNKNKQLNRDLHYRTLSLRTDGNGRPSTLDEDNRSVEVLGATENPIEVFDFRQWKVIKEVLRMDGCVLPGSKQIPLLESHMRWSTKDVLGSYREMRIENETLLGRACFSEEDEAKGPFNKVREGHLTDFSVGYKTLAYTDVKEGETAIVNGKSYTGPLRVTTKWQPKEMSIIPVGADEMAKVRGDMGLSPEHNLREEPNIMPEQNNNQQPNQQTTPNPQSPDTTQARSSVPPTVAGTPPPVDLDGERAEAQRLERERIVEITNICQRAGLPDEVRQELIEEGLPVSEANTRAVNHLTANSPNVGYRHPVEIVADEQDKFRAASQDSLLFRAGVNIEKPAPGTSDLRGYTLREMAREYLRIKRLPVGGNPLEFVGRALASTDLPTVLGAVANKVLLIGFEESSETWQEWCGVGSVSNFQTHTAVRPGEMDDLEEVKEDDEYKYGKTGERKEEYKIATYGKIFKITRQAIINDELAAITNIPRMHGEAAARKIGDIAYAVLTGNAAMGDGVALFDGAHGNVGASGVLSETTIGDAIKKMKLQKDVLGKRRLNIPARFFIAPVALEGDSEIFFTSNMFTGSNAGSTRNNPYAGSRFTRVYDARLDDDSPDVYYFAGPKGKTVVIFFLNGNQSPYLEQRQGFNIDGVEFKVRLDAGAKAMDWRALLRNAGV